MKVEIKAIIELRQQGKTLKEISDTLSIPYNTVKKYASKYADYEGLKFCNNCGNPIPANRLKFCSGECSDDWWRKHRHSKYEYTFHFTCKKCGRAFERPRNDNPKYCSHACYIADRFGDKDERQ